MIRYVNAINNLSALNAHGQFIYIFLFLWGTVLLLSQLLRETPVNKQPWIRCGSSAVMRLGRLTYWLQVHAVRSICEEAMPSDALLLPSYTTMDVMSPCLLVHPHPSSPFLMPWLSLRILSYSSLYCPGTSQAVFCIFTASLASKTEQLWTYFMW